MSRRTQLTPEVQARMVEALRAGAFFRDACDYAGVLRKVAYEWLRRGRDGSGSELHQDFAAAIDNARGTWRVGANKRIDEAGKEDWRATAWQLERHDQYKELRLRNKKLTAEIEMLRKRNDGTLPPEKVDLSTDSEAWRELQRQAFGTERQGSDENE